MPKPIILMKSKIPYGFCTPYMMTFWMIGDFLSYLGFSYYMIIILFVIFWDYLTFLKIKKIFIINSI